MSPQHMANASVVGNQNVPILYVENAGSNPVGDFFFLFFKKKGQPGADCSLVMIQAVSDDKMMCVLADKLFNSK